MGTLKFFRNYCAIFCFCSIAFLSFAKADFEAGDSILIQKGNGEYQFALIKRKSGSRYVVDLGNGAEQTFYSGIVDDLNPGGPINRLPTFEKKEQQNALQRVTRACSETFDRAKNALSQPLRTELERIENIVTQKRKTHAVDFRYPTYISNMEFLLKEAEESNQDKIITFLNTQKRLYDSLMNKFNELQKPARDSAEKAKMKSDLLTAMTGLDEKAKKIRKILTEKFGMRSSEIPSNCGTPVQSSSGSSLSEPASSSIAK
jgi:hypothetical protein